MKIKGIWKETRYKVNPNYTNNWDGHPYYVVDKVVAVPVWIIDNTVVVEDGTSASSVTIVTPDGSIHSVHEGNVRVVDEEYAFVRPELDKDNREWWGVQKLNDDESWPFSD